MATIRERRKKDGTRQFNVQVRMKGYPARSATFRTLRDAKRWAASIEGEMVEGKHFRTAEARRRSLGDAVDRYLKHEAPKKRGKAMHEIALNWWKDQIGDTKLADITPALIVEYRDKLAGSRYTRSKPESKRSSVRGQKAREFPRRPSTVNRYLACLSHLFTVARKEWHWMSYNPMEGVSKLPEDRGRVRCLADHERKALLAETAKDKTLHTFVMVALSTACRAGELQNLTWDDVDLKSGRLLFRLTKNTQPRTAWVHGEALRLLKALSKVRDIKDPQVFRNPSKKGLYQYHKRFRVAVEAAGIHDFRFHDLRHTAATYLARDGATEQQLKAIGGWKSGVVSRYVHLAGEDSRAALKKLAGKVSK